MGEAAGLKAGFSLVWLVVKGRSVSQKGDVSAAEAGQLFGGELTAGEIIAGDAGNFGTHGTVDGDKGGVFIHNEIRVVGKADNPVHFILLCHCYIFLLLSGIVIGGAQEHPVSLFHKRYINVISKGSIKGVDGIGD